MIQIPEDLFAANDDASSGTAAPDFGSELAQARHVAAQIGAGAAATQALHDLDRSFDEGASDPSTWPGAFAAEVQRIRRDDLGGQADDGGLAQDFDDLASAKLATIRRLSAARELENGRQGLQGALDAYANMAAEATSDVEASILRDQAKAAIARMDQAGFLRDGEADELAGGFYDREESARVTRLIDSDPDGAIAALSDPAQFASLAPDARLRLRDRAEIRAEDALRESAEAAERARQGQLAGLMLRLDGGEADRADIMEAAASGWLSDADRERALALWERQRQEIRQREADLSRVRQVFTGAGAPLNVGTEDDRRALNAHYEDTKASWLAAGLSEDQLNPLIVEYLGATRAVPPSLSRDISGIFRDGAPFQRLGIADLLGLLLRRLFEWIVPWSGPIPPQRGFGDGSFPSDWPLQRNPPQQDGRRSPFFPHQENDEPEREPDFGPLPAPWRPKRPLYPEGSETFKPWVLLDAFQPRDLAEGMLINALIDGGWPREKAPDRAAALLAGTLDDKDRFAQADHRAFRGYLVGLRDTGRIAPETFDRIASVVSFAGNATDADPKSSTPAPDTGAAAAASPADPLDPGQRARFNNSVAASGTEPDVAEPAHAPASPEGGDEIQGQASPAGGQPQDNGAESGSNQTEAPARTPGPNLSEETSALIGVADGATDVRDLPRDENGLVRFGKYLLTEEAASFLHAALRPDPVMERELRAQIQASRSLNDAQKGVLLEVLRDRRDKSFLRPGAPSRHLESDAVYALRMLDQPRNQSAQDWKHSFAGLPPIAAASRALLGASPRPAPTPSERDQRLPAKVELPSDIIEAQRRAREIPPTNTINTPERIRQREDWARDLYGSGAAKKERRADIVMGLPGSGKSSQIAEPLAKERGALIIDSDLAKERIPEYRGGIGAAAVHAESTSIQIRVFDTATKNGDNIVLPIVGTHGADVRRTIDALRARGYEVSLHYVDLPLDKALGRAIDRYRETGRFVDPDYISSVGDKPRQNFDMLRSEGGLGAYHEYSTDVPKGQAARKVR